MLTFICNYIKIKISFFFLLHVSATQTVPNDASEKLQLLIGKSEIG